MKNLIYFLILFLLVFASCKKEELEEPQPQPQKVDFLITYNGVSRTLFDERDLIFTINYFFPSSESYPNFSYPCMDLELRAGKIITSPYTFEPGEYEVRGVWDWNKSGTWDPLEPIINPTFFKVDGFSKPGVEVSVLDKQEALNWSVGVIRIGGENKGPAISGEHYMRAILKKSYEELVFHKQLEGLQSGPGLGGDVVIDVGEYFSLTLYWDVNDDQQYNPWVDPHTMITHFYVSPGLTNCYKQDFFVNQ